MSRSRFNYFAGKFLTVSTITSTIKHTLLMTVRKKIFLILISALLCFTGKLWANDKTACNLWVDSVFNTLTTDERIGQLLMYNSPAQLNSKNVNALLNAINEQYIGGLLFWSGTIKEQAELTNVAQASSKVPIMVAMDGEWGLSMRLKDGLRYPRKTSLSALSNETLIYELGVEIGRQCNELGIHISFDPVLDVNLNPENPVINTRSFGDNAEDISRKASLFVQGLENRKIMSVGKHFPGHGDTSQDSHHELAVVTHDSITLQNIDLLPFKQLIQEGMPGVMIGHIAVPAIDSSNTPASLSPIITTTLLKDNLQFKGLVFTDAMKMKGVSNQKDACVRALLAGNDVILDPDNIKLAFDEIKKAIKDSVISLELINEKCKKVLTYKYLYGVTKFTPIDTTNLEKRINTPQAQLIQDKIAKQSITVAKNNNQILPIKKVKDQQISIVSIGTTKHTDFLSTCALYASTTNHYLHNTTNKSTFDSIINIIDSSNCVIIALHNTQLPDSLLANIGNRKKTILISFINTYQLKNYPLSIANADAIIVAYENMPLMQDAAAQVLFGGFTASGKLPVNSVEELQKGQGYITPKTRLGYATPELAGMNSVILESIDTIALNAIEKMATPGCQILIAKKGTVVYHKSFGHHDYTKQQAVKNSDTYDLASITKVAATLPVIMQLYDKGKVNLEKRISHYLPELKHSNKKNCTAYELLTHQAGLKPFIPFYQVAIDLKAFDNKLIQRKKDCQYSIQVDEKYYGLNNLSFKPGFISSCADPSRQLQIADSLWVINAFKDSIWNAIVESPLGEKKYLYSDLSFLMLQRMAEEISEKPLEKLVKDNFYQALGASTTGYKPLERLSVTDIVPTACDSFLRKQCLRGYVHDQNAAFMGGVAGHAGLFSNSNDLAKLFQMIVNGGEYGDNRFFSEKTSTYFTTEKSPISRRGLGFDRYETADGHILYGHNGFTGTCVWIDPKQEIVYIFLSNRVHPDSWNKKLMKMDVRTRIIEKIYQAILP